MQVTKLMIGNLAWFDDSVTKRLGRHAIFIIGLLYKLERNLHVVGCGDLMLLSRITESPAYLFGKLNLRNVLFNWRIAVSWLWIELCDDQFAITKWCLFIRLSIVHQFILYLCEYQTVATRNKRKKTNQLFFIGLFIYLFYIISDCQWYMAVEIYSFKIAQRFCIGLAENTREEKYTP